VAHRRGDPDATPVEVTVVGELRTACCQQLQQPPSGGGRLAADTNQRLACRTELVRGGRHNHRVLADPHPRDGQGLVMAAELAEREHSRLARLAAGRQHPAQGRSPVTRQREAKHQR
jgi:hypothetical protein